MRPIALISLMCLGIIMTLTCYANFPAMQPQFEALWGLTKIESGLIFGIFFGGVLTGTPILSPLADKFDPRRIWLCSATLMALSAFGFAFLAEGFWSAMLFRGLTGLGLSGVYMPGLKILSDRLEGRTQTRATVVYTASFIIGFSVSFAMTGEVAAAFGWQWAFITAGVALVIAALLVLPIPPAEDHHMRAEDTHIMEFRPTLRARPAMAFITAYGAHCWEAFTLGSWSVAVLTFHLTAFEPNLNPAFNPIWVATVAGLMGFPASVIGNELCLRFGRRRVIFFISAASAAVSAIFGFLLWLPYWFLVMMSFAGAFMISLDSGSLGAGMVQRAPKGYTAATMAVYSMAGFGAGLIGPFVFGAVLDLVGATNTLGWGLAYASVGFATLVAPLAMRFMGLKGDPGT
jgi:MFS family permease